METAVSKPRLSNIQFNGTGGEFFRIWIVNLVLSVLTLGIYSAWAKVRTQRYFYGNTRIGGHAFEYLATGGQIFKGRILAVVVFILYYTLSTISTAGSIVVGIVFLIALPWLVNSGLRFNARVSSWRNVRFNFTGSYFEAFMVVFVWPLIGVLTLGILMPMATQRSARYVVSSHSFGEEKFDFSATVSMYNQLIYGLMICYVAAIVALVVGTFNSNLVLSIVGFVGIYALAFFIKPLMFNLYWANVKLKGNGFRPQMPVGRFAWIFLSNSVVVGLTLGLMYPWSLVRMARFTAESMKLVDVGNIDSIAAGQNNDSNAIGEELGEVFDVELGFGV